MEQIPKEGAMLFYKTSPRCHICEVKHPMVEAVAQRHPSITFRVINVLAERELSQELARLSGVEHQSPQVILMRDGETLWHASILEIEEKSLEAALNAHAL